MKSRNVHRALAALACVGMLCPPFAFADEPIARTIDVALRPGGVLVGQVVDQQGATKVGATVALKYNDQEVVRTTTDKNGVFAAQGLRGGQYEIITDGSAGLYRLWGADTAPPIAQPAALVVDGQTVVRGQFVGGYPGYASPYSNSAPDYSGPGISGEASAYGHAWVNWVSAHPLMTAGIMAAAVTAPIVVANSDHGPHS